MFGKKKNKEANRYYLLPGMGKANRRKHQLYFKISLGVGLLASGLVALVLWFLSRPQF